MLQMRLAYIIAVAVFLAAVLITLILLWFFGFFTRRPCLNPLFFADDTSKCVPTNQASLIRSLEEFSFIRRPECRYYLIDVEHVGDDGKVTSMKHAKEITENQPLITVPERKAAIYFLVSEI